MTTKEKLQNINVSDSLTLYDVLTSESVYWSLKNIKMYHQKIFIMKFIECVLIIMAMIKFF